MFRQYADQALLRVMVGSIGRDLFAPLIIRTWTRFTAIGKSQVVFEEVTGLILEVSATDRGQPGPHHRDFFRPRLALSRSYGSILQNLLTSIKPVPGQSLTDLCRCQICGMFVFPSRQWFRPGWRKQGFRLIQTVSFSYRRKRGWRLPSYQSPGRGIREGKWEIQREPRWALAPLSGLFQK